MRGAPPVYGQPPSYRSALLWGALIGILALGAAVLAAFLGVGSSGYQPAGVPDEILVVCPVRDAEGATVGGILFLLDPAGRVDVVDATMRVTIPGTSYETLQDAYPFGGGAAVAAAYADRKGVEIPAWLVLPEAEWMSVVDQAGGAEVEVRESINAYVEGSLVSIEEGKGTLTGSQLAALWASASFADTPSARRSTTDRVAEAVGASVGDSWPTIVDIVREGNATTPVLDDDLREFMGAGL